jgi:hypothetical protein
MRRHSYHVALLVVLCALLTVGVFGMPPSLQAWQRAPVADFAPPMSPAEAEAAVAAARRAQAEVRAPSQQQRAVQDAAGLPAVQTNYFAPSGFHVSDRAGFLTFWRQHGGMLIFGFPISGELVENGRIVQYFERARFEYHPEHYGTENQVQLTLLGTELTADRDFADGAPAEGRIYFPETKQTLGGRFLKFWEKRGGLQVFGFPISEPIEEISPTDGQLRIAQYFERARMEYVPEAMPAFYRQMESANGVMLAALHEIRLGDLGRQALDRRALAPRPQQPLPGAAEWASTNYARHIDVDLTAQMLTAYEGGLAVYRAPIATGRDGFNTPTGNYAIYLKYPIQTMQGSAGGESWYVPDIPWVQYVVGGVALHGTYWHDRWGSGVRMSHGCINLNIDDAQWLYEWADIGTSVEIHY